MLIKYSTHNCRRFIQNVQEILFPREKIDLHKAQPHRQWFSTLVFNTFVEFSRVVAIIIIISDSCRCKYFRWQVVLLNFIANSVRNFHLFYIWYICVFVRDIQTRSCWNEEDEKFAHVKPNAEKCQQRMHQITRFSITMSHPFLFLSTTQFGQNDLNELIGYVIGFLLKV